MSKQLIWNADLRQKPWKVDLAALVAVGTEGVEGQLVGRPAPRERAASSTSLLLHFSFALDLSQNNISADRK